MAAQRKPRRVSKAPPRAPLRLPGEADWFGLSIPKPPSVNRLWRIGKDRVTGKRRMINSAAYDAWIAAATYSPTGRRKLPRIAGDYELVILLGPRKGSDLDNYAKALSDWLQTQGCVENDSLCACLTIRWDKALTAKQAHFFIRQAREAVHASAR